MSTDAGFEALRAANPAATATTDPTASAGLFAAIVAGPADARLVGPPRPRLTRRPRSRARLPRRRLALAVAVVLALTVGTAWATTGSSPLRIFVDNPQESGPADGPWHQSVIPATVRQVALLRIPGVGDATFWYARTREGGWCSAIRLPGGGWAGTGEEPESVDAGGTVPGCQPTREQVNAAGGGPPVYEIDGFDYDEALVGDRAAGGLWRILYGEVTGKTTPTKVVDWVSGRSVGVDEGHLFALAIPSPDPTRIAPVHLVGTDAAGAIVADTAPLDRSSR